jgi:antitoxin VapB
MNDMARIIRTGDGQSVELPEGYRFEGTEVRISREGDQIVLEPVDDTPIDDDAIDEVTGLTIRELDALVQEALDSGPDEPWDLEQVKRYCRGER